ncbi:MAG: tRNA (N(6)-L-threonylcarbamoyladenosine(37)-C(2))-methylthiotransferase MtaB [SAR202 cluster bacterium]|nr:tRNA (N(6)-L-threonylcarbamoyladenosine(37)-C(2))-methylthiotransferase MtaB [SAR202 cluster bacterium]HCP23808.1 tRNA (N(6)-L-threonylcarbamoyladenosine(37)-C(2))-methylthiotransferase MtaB [Dehalococcoidia bacterium]
MAPPTKNWTSWKRWTADGPREATVAETRAAGKTVSIHTHGCKLNQADSQVLARQFQQAGFTVVNSPGKADVVVLNSCTVTATSDSKARQYLRRARRANPDALVIATGCYAQRAKEDLSAMEAVSLVLDNREKEALVATVAGHLKTTNAAPLEIGQGAQGRSRAMVKIQEGCDQVCAYCIVPKVRGRERSIPPEQIIGEINNWGAGGCHEAVLTGTQLGTYGHDLPGTDLKGLIGRVLAETDIDRLRVSSLQPQEITPDLLSLWDDKRLCPHFHIPLQSGSDTILRAMRRRYDTEQFSQTVELVRKTVPHAGITADIIVGFPGEGVREFAESYSFALSTGFSDIHVFPYSIRPGTSAAYLDGQVDSALKKERTGEMLELAASCASNFRRASLGQTRPVLWEPRKAQESTQWWSGLTDNYLRVRTQYDKDLGNVITNARLIALDQDWLTSEVV